MVKFSKSFKCGQCYRIWSTPGILGTHPRAHEPSTSQLDARTFHNAAPQSESDYRAANTLTHTSTTLGIYSVCFDVNLLADVVLYVIVYCVSISMFYVGTHAKRTVFYSFVLLFWPEKLRTPYWVFANKMHSLLIIFYGKL